ncbi:MAG: TRAP transporter fused permease subunit [Rhodospirillales bacterium]|nr:TRAP transporter fused permease subunit [Rhodospirillales bacterium]MDP6644515.1 TRAP transporter fused permease subunit [Rhodospirillales bacterium]MDP6842843.1 TRAP transporter fused permease subunit [Rhodospirillales bacterium]
MAENASEIEQDQEKYLAERVESRLVTLLSLGLGALISIIAITWAIDFWLNLGFTWFDEQAMVACLGLSLAIIFIRYPMKLGTERHAIPWYDYLLALLGMGGALYFVLIFDSIAENPFAMRPKTFIIGLLLMPLVWEGLRRTAGWSLTIVFSVFVAYGFLGHLMPGMLQGVEQKNVDLIAFLATSEVALIGLPLKIIVLTVVLFIWMGQMLFHTGASEWFTDLSAAMMGRSRGGSAKIAVVASSLFGSISGSAVSNVASTGVITIPLMRKAGYDRKTAGAIEAVASTGGQIMPPIMGAAAFLMAELLELAYTEIILAALIPSILYYLAVFVQADLEAAKNGIAALPKDRIPPMLRVMKEGWFFIVPYVVLIYTLFWMNMAPQQAAFWAAISVGVVSIVFGYRKIRITPKQFLDTFASCGRMSVDIIIIGAMAGVIIGILDKTGLGQALTLILAAVGENNLWLLLILTAVISILLGMGMPTSAIYLLLATMIAPSLIKLGINPISAHLFVLYFGLMSMITPPVALAAFAAASLAGAKPMETGMTAVRLGWIAYIIPFVFVLSPSLLMQGGAVQVLSALAMAIIGVWIASCGFIGYLFRPIGVVFRLLFVAAGLALLVPGEAFSQGFMINAIGGIAAVLLIGREFMLRRIGGVASPTRSWKT